MMDHYGNHPAPSKENAILEVVKITGEEKIVRSIIRDIDLGSFTGWYVSVKPSVIKKVKNIIKERYREKIGVEYVVRKIIGDETFTY